MPEFGPSKPIFILLLKSNKHCEDSYPVSWYPKKTGTGPPIQCCNRASCCKMQRESPQRTVIVETGLNRTFSVKNNLMSNYLGQNGMVFIIKSATSTFQALRIPQFWQKCLQSSAFVLTSVCSKYLSRVNEYTSK